jgi:hypothetical protein
MLMVWHETVDRNDAPFLLNDGSKNFCKRIYNFGVTQAKA